MLSGPETSAEASGWSPEEIMASLQAVLKRRYPEWRIRDLREIGGGTEFLVFKGASVLGEVAVRAPRGNVIPYVTPLDPRQVLQQEERLLRHLHLSKVPVPRVLAAEYGGVGPDFLVCQFVRHDDSRPTSGDLGALLREIHACDPPKFACIGEGEGPVHDAVARRLANHLKWLGQRGLLDFAVPQATEIAALMAWHDERSRLLHMDARPVDNILMNRGRIAAVIDWTNALRAHPALELCRMDELGLLDAGFWAAYGDRDVIERPPRRVQLIYRLDTASMLAVLFMRHIPDAQRAGRYLDRVESLWHELE